MDDDGLRQMRSRRRFQTGLLIVLLLFLMDSRSPESQRNSAQVGLAEILEGNLSKPTPLGCRAYNGCYEIRAQVCLAASRGTTTVVVVLSVYWEEGAGRGEGSIWEHRVSGAVLPTDGNVQYSTV